MCSHLDSKDNISAVLLRLPGAVVGGPCAVVAARRAARDAQRAVVDDQSDDESN